MLQPGERIKAQASGSQDCFWAELDGDTVKVHDEHGNVCRFTRREWEAAKAGFVAGDFDLPK